MALVDLATGRTRSFRACAVNQGPQQPVTLIDQKANCYCPTHSSGLCVETFYSQSDLASMSWLQLWRSWRMWKAGRR